jgi:hypothetical protein
VRKREGEGETEREREKREIEGGHKIKRWKKALH